MAGALLPQRGPLPGRRTRHPPAGARALGRRGRRGALRGQGGRAWHALLTTFPLSLSVISPPSLSAQHV